MVVPRAHRDGCSPTGTRTGVTMVSHGSYALFTTGPAALHKGLATQLLSHLDDEYAGTRVGLDDAQMRRWVGTDLARYLDNRPALKPLSCGCAQNLVLCLGGAPCSWDTDNDLLIPAGAGEQLLAPPLKAYAFDDHRHVMQRVLGGFDLRALSIRGDRGASTNTRDVSAWTGGAFIKGAGVSEQSPMDRAEFLGSALAALYAGHRVAMAMEGAGLSGHTQVHIARYATHPTQRDVVSELSVSSATSIKKLRDRIQAICERPLTTSRPSEDSAKRPTRESMSL